MVKLIKKRFKPDDPIFSGRAIVSVPVSRRLAQASQSATAGTNPMQPVADAMEAFLRRKVSEGDDVGGAEGSKS